MPFAGIVAVSDLLLDHQASKVDVNRLATSDPVYERSLRHHKRAKLRDAQATKDGRGLNDGGCVNTVFDIHISRLYPLGRLDPTTTTRLHMSPTSHAPPMKDVLSSRQTPDGKDRHGFFSKQLKGARKEWAKLTFLVCSA